MPRRFSDHALTLKAVAALEEINERGRRQKIEKTPEIRFLLAWLANGAKERWPFDWWWKSLDSEDIGRSQNMNAALNGIKLQLKLPDR